MPNLPIQVWAAWVYALWWLFVAIRDYASPVSPRYKNGRAFYLALVAVAQLAWLGYLLLEGFSLIALAVLVAFGFTWLLWVREASAKKR